MRKMNCLKKKIYLWMISFYFKKTGDFTIQRGLKVLSRKLRGGILKDLNTINIHLPIQMGRLFTEKLTMIRQRKKDMKYFLENIANAAVNRLKKL